MSETRLKYFLGRKVKSEKTITRGPNTEFGALYEATDLLQREHHGVGSLDGNNPIAVKKDLYYLKKWHSLSKEDKDKLDGVLVSSDFRNDSVKIIFFE